MHQMSRVIVGVTAGTLFFVAASRTTSTGTTTDVVTYHNDVARTGQNLNETFLTPTTVTAATFGKTRLLATDGKVDAQPLFLSGVLVPGVGVRDVVYVATEHDSVYAFDASSGSMLWHVSLLGTGETTSDTRGCSQVTPEIGITSTPVIDRSRGANGVVYVVAMSKTAAGAYVQRLHALDAALGSELLGGPQTIQASFAGTGAGSSGGVVNFDPKQYEERAGLLEINGQIVTVWTSHCDIDPYTGWIIAYDAGTLTRSSVLNVTPNGSRGGMWMAGAGPAADAQGNIYVLDGNGTFDTTLTSAGFPNQGDFGNAFLKIATAGGLSVADYFATFDTVSASNADTDLGSGGAMVFPDFVDAAGATRHLAVGAGKDGHLYVVDRDAMGKWNASSNQNYQDISGALGGSVFSMPAYFNNTLYYGASGAKLKAFAIASARVSATAGSSSALSFTYPGTTPSISASGSTHGIVWAVENKSPAVLHAYDATNLATELYNTTQAANGRDSFGSGNKFITPTIVNGRVYVGTPTGVAVFGLLSGPPSPPSNLRIIR
jgi:PQQ enzyme repeat